jgi:hypothetical protein
MPAWESTADPADNGYDDTKSKYRIFFNAAVPGGDFASEIAAGLGNDLILYISTQTTNGAPDWQEMIRAVLQTGIPHEGGESESVQLYAESEIMLSEVTWDYQEFTVDRMSYRSPNQADGKYTYQVPGIISGIQPGFKADSIVLGEIQYIISADNIQMYLKEY